MCAPGSLCLPLKKPTPSRHESQSVTADGIMLRHIIFPAKAWHYYDSVYHSCFMSHELCRKAVPLSWKCISSSCYRSLACRHEPYIRFPAKVWHAYASVYHSCFMSHELCRKAVPLSWKCISSSCYRSLHALHNVDMSHTSDSLRKCDMTMLVYIIVVSRRMNCVGRQFHLVDSVWEVEWPEQNRINVSRCNWNKWNR